MFTATSKRTATALILAAFCFGLASLGQEGPRDEGPPPPDDREEHGILRRAPLDIGDDFIKRLESAEPGDGIELELFEDVSLVSKTVRINERPFGFDWVGKTESRGVGDVMFSVVEGALVGTVWLDAAFYSIRRDGAGDYEVVQVDSAAFSATHGGHSVDEVKNRSARRLKRFGNPRFVARKLAREAAYNRFHAKTVGRVTAGKLPESVLGHLPEPGSRIDIMIATTIEADAWMDRNGYSRSATINNIIAKANTTLFESGIATQLNLVGEPFVFYTEVDEELSGDVDNLRGSPVHPDLQVLHTLRDLLRADIVTLLVHFPPDPEANINVCGRAAGRLLSGGNFPPGEAVTDANGDFDQFGFHVAEVDCAVLGITVTHELGHNMGAAHDNYKFNKTVAEAEAEMPPRSVLALEGAHGFILLEPNVRTVMAYKDFCTEILGQDPDNNPCPYIPRFSNPLQPYDYDGFPTGFAVGTFFGAADNASVLNMTARTVANFRHAYFQ